MLQSVLVREMVLLPEAEARAQPATHRAHATARAMARERLCFKASVGFVCEVIEVNLIHENSDRAVQLAARESGRWS